MFSRKAKVSGFKKALRSLTLDFEGPYRAENPETFRDFHLSAIFENARDGIKLQIPGFFAADGRAGETGADAGQVWRVRFCPPSPGLWRYQARFRCGADVALIADPEAGAPIRPIDAAEGAITIEPAEPSENSKDLLFAGPLREAGSGLEAATGVAVPRRDLGDWRRLLASAAFSGDGRVPVSPPALVEAQASGLQGVLEVLAGAGPGVLSVDLTAASLRAEELARPLETSLRRSAGPWREPLALTPEGAPDYAAAGLALLCFDVSRLDEWGALFEQILARGVALEIALGDASSPLWSGPALAPARRLLLREMAARFGHLGAVLWRGDMRPSDAAYWAGLTPQRDHAERRAAADSNSAILSETVAPQAAASASAPARRVIAFAPRKPASAREKTQEKAREQAELKEPTPKQEASAEPDRPAASADRAKAEAGEAGRKGAAEAALRKAEPEGGERDAPDPARIDAERLGRLAKKIASTARRQQRAAADQNREKGDAGGIGKDRDEPAETRSAAPPSPAPLADGIRFRLGLRGARRPASTAQAPLPVVDIAEEAAAPPREEDEASSRVVAEAPPRLETAGEPTEESYRVALPAGAAASAAAVGVRDVATAEIPAVIASAPAWRRWRPADLVQETGPAALTMTLFHYDPTAIAPQSEPFEPGAPLSLQVFAETQSLLIARFAGEGAPRIREVRLWLRRFPLEGADPAPLRTAEEEPLRLRLGQGVVRRERVDEPSAAFAGLGVEAGAAEESAPAQIVIEALGEPDRRGDRLLRRFAAPLTPAGGLEAALAQGVRRAQQAALAPSPSRGGGSPAPEAPAPEAERRNRFSALLGLARRQAEEGPGRSEPAAAPRESGGSPFFRRAFRAPTRPSAEPPRAPRRSSEASPGFSAAAAAPKERPRLAVRRLELIDAESDRRVAAIRDGGAVNGDLCVGRRITVKAIVAGLDAERVETLRLTLETGAVAQRAVDRPQALVDERMGLFYGLRFDAGEASIIIEAFDGAPSRPGEGRDPLFSEERRFLIE